MAMLSRLARKCLPYYLYVEIPDNLERKEGSSMERYEKTGYLNGDYRIFHIQDNPKRDFAFHYHDFNKIILFLRGNVTYCIEGKSYDLKPYDLVLVKAGEVHRPIIHDNATYERIIMYISPEFIGSYRENDYDLSYCFSQSKEEHSNVLRMADMKHSKLYRVMTELEESFHHKDYASELYHNTLFVEFMIHLNRAAIHNSLHYMVSFQSNEKILEVLSYMNQHLTEELSIDILAERFYTSRYYLMHSFKEQTGYTIGNYLSTKRLLYARELILGGTSMTDACFACGFRNYSTFSRAYKKQFRESPRELLY